MTKKKNAVFEIEIQGKETKIKTCLVLQKYQGRGKKFRENDFSYLDIIYKKKKTSEKRRGDTKK